MSEIIEKPKPDDMEITPERALMIKKALIKQYEDQFGVIVTGWKEINTKQAVSVGS